MLGRRLQIIDLLLAPSQQILRLRRIVAVTIDDHDTVGARGGRKRGPDAKDRGSGLSNASKSRRFGSQCANVTGNWDSAPIIKIQVRGTKSYSPRPWRTRNTADVFPALVTRCGRFGGTEKVWPRSTNACSFGSWRKMRIAPSMT